MAQLTPNGVTLDLASRRRDPHPQLAAIASEATRESLPMVGPDIGALLHTLALSCGAQRILEIGTAIGYSALWLATALPAGGMMISMERDPARAARARHHLAAAGRGHQVSVMVGDAARFLHKIAGPFDLIFQDSDPALYETMHHRLVDLLRPGGLLVAGKILGNGDAGPMVAFTSRLTDDPRLYTSFLPVGDGVSISVKRAS